jgi:L-threonylcarbamoyladenylate synthase
MNAVHTTMIDDAIVSLLSGGGVGILRTDTLYGIVARADNEAAVERVYSVKGRTPTKPPIILIASTDQLLNDYDQKTMKRVSQLWPGKVSVILPAPNAPKWLVRSGDSLAYRMPNNPELRELLQRTGPLVAPSANPEGLPPAMDINEAVEYFGEKVDFYVDGGRVEDNTPSQLYRLLDDDMERLR